MENSTVISHLQFDQASADSMVDKAIAYSAEKKFSGDVRQARLALCQGRCDVCSCMVDNLVYQIGEYLGNVDRTVQAIYRYEPEYVTVRPQFQQGNVKISRGGINLITLVDRKSAALSALGNTLEALLAVSRQKISCKNANPACYTLDVQMVDKREVLDRRGYGAIINSAYVRSTQVWTRIEPSLGDARVSGYSDSLNSGVSITYDPEYSPESILFEQAMEMEKTPPHERLALEHRLREIKVILIRRLISDQLSYINIAKEWFTIADLEEINKRKIGNGKIGGKAAGMLLAHRILREVAEPEILNIVQVPESFFLGSDVIYLFMAMNGLMHWNDQKYKPEIQIRSEYPQIMEEFENGEFPPEILNELGRILIAVGNKPVIVRSSSQLEDNFGTAFAGKYDSHFCPNQGSLEENLYALTKAISRTYASTLKPEALLYRRSKGLQDYDERMAILIQTVQGEIFEHYFLPHAAGVAFSRNLYRWSPEIRREDGFARLVWGLGTRAVERVGNDYPRLVALSHPTLQPDDSCAAIRRYSQQFVDVIDLAKNAFVTMPLKEVIKPSYPVLRFIAQIEQDDYFTTPKSRIQAADIPRLAITFDELLRRTPFPRQLSKILRCLEENYHDAVDMEFTLQVIDPRSLQAQVMISLLQCRPQSYLKSTITAKLPSSLKPEKIVFQTQFMVPQGVISDIRWVLFIPPEPYFQLPSARQRKELAGLIGQINSSLEGNHFFFVGPGRWGTLNTDLGVYVSYADICNANALIELSGKGVGPAPEPSLGTHFFQDLMEAQIYPLAVCLDDPAVQFNHHFFYDTPNRVSDFIQCDEEVCEVLRLIDVNDFLPNHSIELIMDDEAGKAIAYFKTPS